MTGLVGSTMNLVDIEGEVGTSVDHPLNDGSFWRVNVREIFPEEYNPYVRKFSERLVSARKKMREAGATIKGVTASQRAQEKKALRAAGSAQRPAQDAFSENETFDEYIERMSGAYGELGEEFTDERAELAELQYYTDEFNERESPLFPVTTDEYQNILANRADLEIEKSQASQDQRLLNALSDPAQGTQLEIEFPPAETSSSAIKAGVDAQNTQLQTVLPKSIGTHPALKPRWLKRKRPHQSGRSTDKSNGG